MFGCYVYIMSCPGSLCLNFAKNDLAGVSIIIDLGTFCISICD